MKKKNNNQVTLEYLLTGKIVTTRMAPEILGIADIRNNIATLRKLGFKISDRWVIRLNRRGVKTRYKEYYIEKELLLTEYSKLIASLNIRTKFVNKNV